VTYEITWGGFALIEFLIAERHNIGSKYKTCLDIGCGDGVHGEIMNHAGLKVTGVDKYSDKADYNMDFMSYTKAREMNFNVVFCSHVIEHQRNVGSFLDRIYDVLSDDGVLIISAPNHPAETLIEGHINSFIFPLFLQQLIHAGFDCKSGKYLSLIENSFIVSKAKDFELNERLENGYQWTEKHQNRSPIELKNSTIDNSTIMVYNCSHVLLGGAINSPGIFYDMTISMPRWNFQCTI
jgi:2-polyprenyl-3-methyl-5-hydroxy-6-metoxy-1,4-benzoquinol methylase